MVLVRRGYDVDQVFADFDGGYRKLIMAELGIIIPEMSSTFPTVWGWDRDYLTSAEISEMWQEIRTTDFWWELEPLPECHAALAMLTDQQNDGDDVYFITNRPGSYAKRLTEEWLENQGFSLPTVLISSDKGSVCKGLGIEMFVDDKPENCWEVNKACPEAQVFLLDAPYNRTPDACWVDKGEIVRVQSILDPRIMGQGALVDG